MFCKKDFGNSFKVEQLVVKVVSYEIIVVDMVCCSEWCVWWVVIGLLLMLFVLVGGYYYMLLLKEKVLFLVMVDVYMGMVMVVCLSGMFQGEMIIINEVINCSNVVQYVFVCELYDLVVMGLCDWELVFVMFSSLVVQSMCM